MSLKRTYSILIAISMALGVHAMDIEAPCGSWYQLTAMPQPDYHFLKWSDGNTEQIRQIQVNENATYIAFFAANCGDYGNLPIVALYDWLLMLDVRSVQARGYYFEPEHVSWYCVKGEIDSIDSDKPRDDVFYGTGYYLTLDSSLVGTGDYYAVVDVSHSPSGVLCHGLMRSIIAHYASMGKAGMRPILNPTIARSGETLTLSGLNDTQPVMLTLYDINGHLVAQRTVHDTRYQFEAPVVAGCYCLVVATKEERCVIRFIVSGR